MYRSSFRPLALASLVALAACSQVPVQATYPEPIGKNEYDPTGSNKPRDTIFGQGGLSLGGNSARREGDGGAGIGVNSYLWRASLDTVAFMPLSSADPFGGVIITDWYSPAQAASERFKITVYILDRALRADGVKVAVFKQVRQGEQWVDAPVAAETALNLENAILSRARQMRVDSAGL